MIGFIRLWMAVMDVIYLILLFMAWRTHFAGVSVPTFWILGTLFATITAYLIGDYVHEQRIK
jgi:hypothetical protein